MVETVLQGIASKYGLTVFYEPEDAVVDIVFIHGINGDPVASWTSPGDKINPAILWPRDLLPSWTPKARILSWGYDSPSLMRRNAPVTSIDDHGFNLLNDLLTARVEVEQRPVIFVCHGFGGLVAKSALSSNGYDVKIAQKLQKITKGIVFMGTPHRGYSSGLEMSMNVNKTLLRVYGKRPSPLYDNLRPNSEFLERLDLNFCTLIAKYGTPILSVYETSSMGMGMGPVVQRHSALLHLPSERVLYRKSTHAELGKFATAADPAIRQIAEEIEYWIYITQFAYVPDHKEIAIEEQINDDQEALVPASTSILSPEAQNTRPDADPDIVPVQVNLYSEKGDNIPVIGILDAKAQTHTISIEFWSKQQKHLTLQVAEPPLFGIIHMNWAFRDQPKLRNDQFHVVRGQEYPLILSKSSTDPTASQLKQLEAEAKAEKEYHSVNIAQDNDSSSLLKKLYPTLLTKSKRWIYLGKISPRPADLHGMFVKLDTGSETKNFISYEKATTAGLVITPYQGDGFGGATNSLNLTPMGVTKASFTFSGTGKLYEEEFQVVEDFVYDALLGEEFCLENHLISFNERLLPLVPLTNETPEQKAQREKEEAEEDARIEAEIQRQREEKEKQYQAARDAKRASR